MKTLLKTLTGLVLTTSMAWASDSVNIDVSVTTDAAACIPTLSNNGIVDFGKRSAASLSGTHFTQWGSRA
jgi:type 1 fimbria pilin